MNSADSDTRVGSWVIGQFVILRPLESGGMAHVYLAEQPSMERYAAIKILKEDQPVDDKTAQRFAQEARMASRLTHPNIVIVYNFGALADGSLFIAMEYIEGGTVAHKIDRGHLSMIDSVAVVKQCAEALNFAATHKVIHRDIKPQNIMLSQTLGVTHVKIVDFGLASPVHGDRMTTTGALVGTPQYMSPEQCRGESLTSMSDQYSLGLTFYEMLAGRTPIFAQNALAYLQAHQNYLPPTPSEVRALPGMELLDSIVMRMIAKKKEERYAWNDLLGELHNVELRLLGKNTLPNVPLRPSRANANVAVRQVRVWPIGETILSPMTPAASLTSRGYRFEPRVSDATWLPALSSEDVVLVGLTKPEEKNDLSSLKFDKLPLDKSIFYLPLSPSKVESVDLAFDCHHVVVGNPPIDPLHIALVLDCVQRPGTCAIESFAGQRAVQLLQVSDSAERSAYLETVLDDLRAQNIRQRARRLINEICAEMISNAIFHAPVGVDGKPKYRALDRDTRVVLQPGEESTLRWVVTEKWIALSICDPFGSLSVEQVMRGTMGTLRSPTLTGIRRSAGIGLQIIGRGSHHLIVIVRPGQWCEVLALVECEPSDSVEDRRTVSILNHRGETTRKIGRALNLIETQSGDTAHLVLVGEIDESSDLGALYRRSGDVVIDLAGITRINSGGVCAWLEAVRLKHQKLKVDLARCSPAIVSQINMLSFFQEHHRVVSILAPYFCSQCRQESLEVVRVTDLRPDATLAFRCKRCDSLLELDELPSEYFSFSKRDM